MFSFRIKRTGDGSFTDYTDFVYSGGRDIAVKNHVVNGIQSLEIRLREASGFLDPERHNRVEFDVDTYSPSGDIFTGYIVNDPEKVQDGTDPSGGAVNVWRLFCQSEEAILNLESARFLPTLPPFLNKNGGDIVKFLIDLLAPGTFDVAGVEDGPFVPFFELEEDENFTGVVRRLCDQNNVKFWTRRGKAFLAAFDDVPLGVDAKELDGDWDPRSIRIDPRSLPIFNTVLGFGDIEPQAYVREYFVGDALSMRFPLAQKMFGVEEKLLLQDDLDDSSIDTALWSETDPGSHISESTSLSVTGGNGIDSTKLVAQNNLEMGGDIDLQHGAFRFVSASDGIVGGLYTSPTVHSQANCMFGFKLTPSGGETAIEALVDGAVPSGAAKVITQSGKEYVLLTRFHNQIFVRGERAFFSLNTPSGFSAPTPSALSSEAFFRVLVLDVNDPDSKVSVDLHTETRSDTPPFLSYALLNSADLNVALNFCNISIPINALLKTKESGATDFRQRSLRPASNFESDATVLAEKEQVLAFIGDRAPKFKELIELQYRSAGRARAKIKRQSNIDDEANRAGDSGVRAGLLPDVPFPPRNAVELEQLIKAYIDDRTLPQYTGEFVIDTFKRTPPREPIPGRFLTVNCSSKYPSFQGFVTEVQTSIMGEVSTLAASSVEVVRHTVSFGQLSRFETHLKRVQKGHKGKLVGDRTVVPDKEVEFTLVDSQFNSHDPSDAIFSEARTASTYQVDMRRSPPVGNGGEAGHWEVRNTDGHWGVPGGSNLVFEPSGVSVFTLPRSNRRQSYYVKPVKPVNLAIQSGWQDGQASIFEGGSTPPTASWTGSEGFDDLGAVKIVWPTGGQGAGFSSGRFNNGTLTAVPTGTVLGWRIKAKLGRSLTGSEKIRFGGGGAGNIWNPDWLIDLDSTTPESTWVESVMPSTKAVPTVGTYYLYVWISGTLTAPLTMYFDDLQIEKSPPAGGSVKHYKTTDKPKGPVSRYPALVQINFPLVPAALPPATVDTVDRTRPVITLVLPNDARDIFGVEIRDPDDATVIYFEPDVNVDGQPLPVIPGGPELVFEWLNPSAVRAATLFAYAWNGLQEYSPSLSISIDMPALTVSGLALDEAGREIKWDPDARAKFFDVEVASSSDFSGLTTSGRVAGAHFRIPVSDVTNDRWFRVRADDGLGGGPWASGFHSYATAGPAIWNNTDNTLSLPAPADQITDPVIPDQFLITKQDLIQLAWEEYIRNRLLQLGVLKTIAVMNMATPERYFSLFQVEMYNSARTQLIASKTIGASFSAPSGEWQQQSVMPFSGLTRGTVYSFRSRVHPQGGGDPSSWSAFIDETAGDTTAPSTTYSATVDLIHKGLILKLNPSGSPSDHDRFDVIAKITSPTPAEGDAPTHQDFTSGGNFLLGEFAGSPVPVFIWARDVDMSGNRQAWVSLGSFNPLLLFGASGELLTGLNFVDNPNLEAGDAGWTKGTGWTIENNPTDAYDGDWVAKHTGASNTSVSNNRYVAAKEGDRFLGVCFTKKPTGAVGGLKVRLSWSDSNKSEIGQSSGAVISPTSYGQSRAVGFAPSGTAFVRVMGTVQNTPDGDIFVDQFILVPVPKDADIDALLTTNAPAEAGANVTETRTSADTTLVNAVAAAIVQGNANRAGLGLDASGDLARNILIARATSSNLLRRTSGGLYAGDLAATLGADWAANLTSRPGELTDGRVANGLTSAGDLARNVIANRVIEASILAGALSLAKMKADALARMFTGDAKRTNVEGLENNGELKAVRFNTANFGIKTLANNLLTSSKSSPATGWVAYPITASIDVPDETVSLILQMVLPSESAGGSRRISTGIDNIGFSITSGAGPATPQVSRQGNGSLTQSSPVKGAGLTLTLYINFTTGTFLVFGGAKINQDTVLPVAIGKVT